MNLFLQIYSKFNNDFNAISAMRYLMTTEEKEVKRPLINGDCTELGKEV